MPAKRWHPSQESDELVFAVLSRFLEQLGAQYDPAKGEPLDGERRGGAAAIAQWLRETHGRADLTRERIYPLFWEAARRKFLLLQPPREQHFARKIADRYGVARFQHDSQVVQVVNVRGMEASGHVSTVGADLLLTLIKRVGLAKRQRGAADASVHVGLGGGFSAMMVAKRLAEQIYSDLQCPPLVLHALSGGGFLVDEPQKAPVTYFAFFDDVLVDVRFVALFSATVVPSGQYEQVISNPGVHEPFERADEIDIVVTSFAEAGHRHGLLNQYLKHLIDKGELHASVLDEMMAAGWIGDVQFRPYGPHGPLVDECPVKAVTLFELEDMVARTAMDDKYVVLLAGPCGECGQPKTAALRPLLTEPKLRLWTHLVTDVQTASELLQ